MQAFRIIILLLGLSSLTMAQSPFGRGGSSRGGIPTGEQGSPGQQGDYKEENPDTATIYYLYANNPSHRIHLLDTTLSNYFEQYDPARARLLDYGHLGTIGTAAQQLIYQPRFQQGVEVGLNQFDLYRENARLKFFQIHNAFTDVSYSQGGDQSDGYLKLQFARNFAQGLRISLHHERIFHLVDETTIKDNGSYLPLRNRYNIFGIGLWYHAPNGKYDGFFSYNSDAVEHADNGGITPEAETLLQTGNNGVAYTIETFLKSASTRYDHEEIAYHHYFTLARSSSDAKSAKKDSTANQTSSSRAFNFGHQISWKNSTYKYADDSSPLAEAFYENFPVDDRGMRHYIGIRTLENYFSLNTNRTTSGSGSGDLLELGLKHAIHWVNQEPLDSVLNNLFLTAKINFSLKDRLRLNTYGHYGILANGGDYYLNGILFFDLVKAGKLELEATSQRYTPSLIQKRIFFSKDEFWNNDFKKPLENSIGATYTTPKFPIAVTGRIHLLDNYIYSDTSAYFKQSNNPITIFQLIGKANFKFWKFHLDNVVALQQTTSDEIRLPQIYSTHSFYFESLLFKNAMRLKLGMDARINTSYFAKAYQPLTGQFYLQDEEKTPFYPAVDAYLSFKVTRYSFKFFFRVDNIGGFLLDDFYYQTYRYPFPDNSIRLGFNWRFLN